MYSPPQPILEKYAQVLVHFGIGGGKGMKPGAVVLLVVPETAKPLFLELRKAILKAGGHVISHYLPADEDRYQPSRTFFELANPEQLSFIPTQYWKGVFAQCQHQIAILGETEESSLEDIDPKKISIFKQAQEAYWHIRQRSENEGAFDATVALYPTSMMAKRVGISLKDYWNQVIQGCYLDDDDPVTKWKTISQTLRTLAQTLTTMKVKKLHIEGEDVDLWVELGQHRKWVAARGANIPSFEVYTSPDWRGTEGWIRFNQPAFHYGVKMRDIYLRFEKGVVTEAVAESGESALKALLHTQNGNKVGEFSLTDNRYSRITHFMAETLFDENMGGPFGNTHIALGKCYQNTFTGNPAELKADDWKDMGFNQSGIHMDLISTTDRVVTAYLENGEERVIYKEGQFRV